MTTNNNVSAMTKPHKAEPWITVKDYIPKEFGLTKQGVFLDKNDPIFISGPCWVTALTRSNQSSDWGYVIHWIDHDGNEQYKAFPMHRVMDSSCTIAMDLSSMGLKIIPSQQRRLRDYIAGFDLPTEMRLQSVSKLGWLNNNSESPVYVLPEKSIGMGTQEEIIFQPEEHSPTINTMSVRGNIEQWKQFVAKPCEGNPILVFSICAALAAPILKYANLESGGFHIYGSSSKGKTTALQVAASVWGCGSDPAVSENTFISRWNTTGNALEGTAAAHNDGLLALDEMGTCDAKDFGKVIYDLLGGQGKRRMNKNSTLKEQKSWRILALSTGEISTRQKIEESGRIMHTGQGVRMLDIPINDGVLIDAHNKLPAEFINDLKKYTGRFYGITGRKFIESLVSMEADVQALRQNIQDRINIIQNQLSHNRTLETYQQRVIQRFAAVITAGHLAVEFGLLPLNKDEITKSGLSLISNWLGDDSNTPEPVRAIRQLKDFVISNRDYRFKKADDYSINTGPKNIIGFFHTINGENLILFTKSGFQEACPGFDLKTVLKELKSSGHLKHESGKLMYKFKLNALPRTYYYAVRTQFLEDDNY